MKSRYLVLFAFSAFALTSCGGGSDGSSVPNVAGVYNCSSNCTGACDFPATLTITQDESSIIVETATGNQLGTINDNGEFDTTADNGSCSGQIVQGTAIFDCSLDNVDCQQVTYKHQ